MVIEDSPLETAAGDITTPTTTADSEGTKTTNPSTLVLDEQLVASTTSATDAVEAFNVKSVCLGPAAVIDTDDDAESNEDDFDDILKVMGWDTRAPKDPPTAVTAAVVKTTGPKTGPKPVTKPRPK